MEFYLCIVDFFQIGTVAGNLMLKHRVRTFSSDVFLLLECVGALLTIGNVMLKGKRS